MSARADAAVYYRLLDAERLDQLQKIRSLNAQNLRSGCAVAAGLLECLQDQLSPAGVDAGTIRKPAERRFRLGGHDPWRQVVHRERRFLAEHDGAFDDVGQLSDVARPVVSGELFLDRRCDLDEGFLGFRGKALKEIAG